MMIDTASIVLELELSSDACETASAWPSGSQCRALVRQEPERILQSERVCECCSADTVPGCRDFEGC